jgi:hypothetical protein
MPISATEGVNNFSGAFDIAALIATENKPDLSATPAPSITTKTYPNGWKPVKVAGISIKSRRMLSEEIKLWALTIVGLPFISTEVGWKADIPQKLATMLAIIIPIIHQTNIKTGSGSLLPERSIQASNPEVLSLIDTVFIFGL